MKLFLVKFDDKNGTHYLRDAWSGCQRICAYPEIEARKKANQFRGKIEQLEIMGGN